jgi:hypothetical protein
MIGYDPLTLGLARFLEVAEFPVGEGSVLTFDTITEVANR